MLVVMFVDLRWSVKFSLRTGVLEEQDGGVWVCPGLSLDHWSTSNEHFQL